MKRLDLKDKKFLIKGKERIVKQFSEDGLYLWTETAWNKNDFRGRIFITNDDFKKDLENNKIKVI